MSTKKKCFHRIYTVLSFFIFNYSCKVQTDERLKDCKLDTSESFIKHYSFLLIFSLLFELYTIPKYAVCEICDQIVTNMKSGFINQK